MQKYYRVIHPETNVHFSVGILWFEDIAFVRLFQEKVWKAFREDCGDAAYKRSYKKAKGEDYYEIHREVSSFAIANNISKDQVRLKGIDYPEDLEL